MLFFRLIVLLLGTCIFSLFEVIAMSFSANSLVGWGPLVAVVRMKELETPPYWYATVAPLNLVP